MYTAQGQGKIILAFLHFDCNKAFASSTIYIVIFRHLLFMSLCVCSLLSWVFLFMIFLSSPGHRDLPSFHLHRISNDMREKEVFQFHVATAIYTKCPMSLYKTRQETSSTWSSFPAGVQHGLLSLLVPQQGFLSLLVPNRVFFP